MAMTDCAEHQPEKTNDMPVLFFVLGGCLLNLLARLVVHPNPHREPCTPICGARDLNAEGTKQAIDILYDFGIFEVAKPVLMRVDIDKPATHEMPVNFLGAS